MRRLGFKLLFPLVILLASLQSGVWGQGWIGKLIREATAAGPSPARTVDHGNSGIEAAFSPDRGAEQLIVKVIDASQRTLRVAAYSFTSKSVAEALLRARRRGVDVQVVLDKSQVSERYTSATFLANVGIPVRIDSEHAIQHNKFIVADGNTVQTGSFNYTASAATRNAENVLVIWGQPRLAEIYVTEWQRHWNHALPYSGRY